ncbi:MAG: hypothetical protein KatS3mg014_2211 [Actinomycetota bacterium]|nr:MAG: hypothetical protein KatS3mg014_2211 [Actinomycetota bacterium]
MRRSTLALVVALALAASACVGAGEGGGAGTTSPPTPSGGSPSGAPWGRGSAERALRELCDYGPPPGSEPVPPEGPTPPVIAETMDALEELRGLPFTERVVAEAVTPRELIEGLEESFDYAFPRGLLERRSRAWSTMGVIGEGVSIREELERFVSGQVIGYYDTLTGELRFIGTEEPSPRERVTLAHELIHALDDQHFGLERIDHLMTSCRDEAATAAIALTEGDATFFMSRYALEHLTPQEQLGLATDLGGETPTVEPFIERQQIWPYTAGQAFVATLVGRGGVDAVDAAFRELPVSTEQIIHPDRYPDDVPTPVDVPELGPALGPGWEDLDVQEVGEAWLSIALGLRLPSSTAAEAAAGWDGGLYRAWTDGERVAVVLVTAWDAPEEAEAFAEAMGRWIAEGEGVGEVLPVEGSSVRVLFATDAATLGTLRDALGSGA